jgi:hypothetical protein
MMDSQLTISGADYVNGATLLECDRVGCGWTHRFDGAASIEDVNAVAADHWADHVLEVSVTVSRAIHRLMRETIDDLRLRVVEIIAETRPASDTPQDTGMHDHDDGYGPHAHEGDDRPHDHDRPDLSERLHTAHAAVWTCADCGSSEMVSQSDGSLRCDGCGRIRQVDAGMLAAEHSRWLAEQKQDDAGFPAPE